MSACLQPDPDRAVLKSAPRPDTLLTAPLGEVSKTELEKLERVLIQTLHQVRRTLGKPRVIVPKD